MKKMYLLTTKHLEKHLWFKDEEDFKIAMNYVAIEAAHHPEVSVLVFILMSNHVHFLLKGREAAVVDFLNQFKLRYSIYYRRKYGVKEFLRRNTLDIKLIPLEDEAAERAMAYVQMNCVAANICAYPALYPWGTGRLFFNPNKPKGMRLGDLSARARKRMLHSEDDQIPTDWLYCDEGYILPESYVDIEAVEAMFRSPRRMNYFLANSSKARKRLETAEDRLPAFRDQTILAALPDLCRSLFQKESFREMGEEEQREFVRQLRFRFSADTNQIARVCGLSYTEAARLMDSI